MSALLPDCMIGPSEPCLAFTILQEKCEQFGSHISHLVPDREQLFKENADLRALLASAVKIAAEAAEEWDKAPAGMRAGKILLALAGHRRGYRPDTDAIHAALAPLHLVSATKE